MELEQIMQLIEKVSDSTLTAFDYEADGVKITMEHGKMPEMVPVMAAQTVQNAASDMPVKMSAAAAAPAVTESSNGCLVTSPLVGTFYAAPSEDAAPFVQIGDTVKKGQVLAIVEAMKLMNEIESDYDGVVKEILVKSGEMVDYGKPLFRIG
ncbi:MAG: acetyl-CoA carboxylase biotin carboxyl carrier protein [Fusicatenibacter sp.]|nr:acetyl-CoA carboxylase biotin carboxyl carrier protein [Lachnospiraceae bacterium]MDY2937115.1 acetyl-CoA carboxylase biotin carboxyl carrier protein [Fusicatenibacter sp.]